MTTPLMRVVVLLVLVAVGVRFFNRTADFPPDVNWSGDIYTDEGWYNHAAAEHLRTGSWYVPGDMNTAINHPVSPLIQRAMFTVSGRSLSSARLTVCLAFALTAVLVFVLARRFADPLAGGLAALLLSINFFVFAYSRIASLDVLSTMFAVAALAVVMQRDRAPSPGRIAATALLLAAAILTKSSAVFGVPLVAAAVWMPGRTFRDNLRQSALIALAPLALVGMYVLVAYYSFTEDYTDYLATVAPTVKNFFTAVYDVIWKMPLGRSFAGGALLLALMGLAFSRDWRQSRLTWLCVLWIGTELVLLTAAQYVAPRYYVPLAVPLAILGGTAVSRLSAERRVPIVAALAWMVLGGIVAVEGRKFVEYVSAPAYTFVAMARQVAAIVRDDARRDDARPALLVGAVAASVGLETGIRTIGSVYGPRSIGWKLDRYDPTFWLAFSDQDIRPELESRYRLSEVGVWDVFGNYRGGERVRLFALERRSAPSAMRR